MTTINIGQPVPEFSALINGGETFTLSQLQGRNIVLYFYPKDNTPGCTTEGQDFKDHFETFQTLDTDIFGVSRDSVKSHDNFCAKYQFPFKLISDQDEALCKLFDVIKLKKMYGKESLGIERSTFIIDKNGILRYEWRKVKVPGHVAEVLATLKSLS